MSDESFFTSRLDEAIGWARKYSIFQYPFVTACCGMEYMATACSHYDVDRFGAGFPDFLLDRPTFFLLSARSVIK
jgi:NADH-quinone oxidoreductase subunit B